jgi:hypothetical protein
LRQKPLVQSGTTGYGDASGNPHEPFKAIIYDFAEIAAGITWT